MKRPPSPFGHFPQMRVHSIAITLIRIWGKLCERKSEGVKVVRVWSGFEKYFFKPRMGRFNLHSFTAGPSTARVRSAQGDKSVKTRAYAKEMAQSEGW